MAGGKGGSQSTKVPAWVEEAGQRNLARANEIAQLGPVEYRGPDVAAFTPMQQAAFANTGAAAGAYGLSGGGMTGMEGMPVAQQMAGGGYGYSAAPIYEQSVSELQARAPGQYDFIRSMFIDPVTGARPYAPFGTQAAPVSGGVASGGGAVTTMPIAMGDGAAGGIDQYGFSAGGGWAGDPSRDANPPGWGGSAKGFGY
jgi:hypothetical protein